MAALVGRVVKIAAGALALVLYVWFAAVTNLGRVRRRKRLRRRRGTAERP